MMLMRLPRWKKREKKHYFLDYRLNRLLLAQKDLATRLQYEKLRYKRSGLPMALVIIDLAGVLRFLRRQNSLSQGVFLRCLADVLRKTARETDIKGWYSHGTVALLATNTDEQAAHVLAEKLSSHMAELLPSNSGLSEKALKQFISISAGLGPHRQFQNH